MRRLHNFLLLLVLTNLRQNALGGKIINGKKVDDSSMLYMASLQYEGWAHMCGGFLISEDFVLTAAHCYNESLVVFLGAHDLRNVDDSMKYDVKTCIHPSYEDVGKGYDIMLLKLSRKAQLGDRVQTVPLPSRDMDLKDNEKCLVAGWGLTRTDGDTVDELLQVDVPIMTRDLCEEKWHGRMPDGVICAGGRGRVKEPCEGDSGGPLVCGGTAVGIVSFGGLICEDPDLPNVYTEISKFLPWIKNILEKNDC